MNMPAYAGLVDTAWIRSFNGFASDRDEANAITVDDFPHIYVTGFSTSTRKDMDYTTIKYDAEGNEVWSRIYNGPANANDDAYGIVVDWEGNIYVVGFSWGIGTQYDYVTTKYDWSGGLLWVRRYNGPANSSDYPSDIALDFFENVFVTGSSHDSITGFDWVTIKYYANGDVAWLDRYNGQANGQDYASDMTEDACGNIYVTGSTQDINRYFNCTTIKYDSSGNKVWLRQYQRPDNHDAFAYALAIDKLGNICVTGEIYGIETSSDWITMKYDPNGTELWVKRYNGPADYTDAPYALVMDDSGGVYVTGVAYGKETSLDWATIKYDAYGNEVWVKYYNGPGNGPDGPSAIVTDGLGNIYVTGHSCGIGSYYDFTTIKYDPNGNDVWIQRYDGAFNLSDMAEDIVLDDSANIYVTGFSQISVTGDFNFVTIKYVQGQTAVEERRDQLGVNGFNLYQNYPNPFNQETNIEYSLINPEYIILKIFNIKGQLVRTMVSKHQNSGIHQVSWDGKDSQGNEVSTGIYFYKLKAGDFTQTKKMVLLK